MSVPGTKPPRRLSPLTPLVRGGLLLVAAAGALWRDLLSSDGLGPGGLLLAAALVAGLGYGVVSWALTRYWIDEVELRVDTGVLVRQSRRIRIDRLQGVDIVQPLLARLFGLAEVRLDVAGGGAREGSLAFLPLGEAREVRQTLLARRAEAVRQSDATGEPAGAARSGPPPPHRPDLLLVRLDPALLVASLLLSGGTLGVAVGAVTLTVLTLTSTGPAGMAGLAFPLFGLAAVQVRRLMAYHRFTVSDTDTGLRVSRGLTSLVSQTIALHRVQGVVVSEPALWRLAGWARVDVSVAGYGGSDEEGQAESTVLPVGPRAQAYALARHVLRGLDLQRVALDEPPRAARWAAPVRWRFFRFGLDGALLVSRTGMLGRRTHAVPHARVQSLRLAQGPWQRRLGVADLLVDSPPGPVAVRGRHRGAEPARALLDRAVVLAREARAAPSGRADASGAAPATSPTSARVLAGEGPWPPVPAPAPSEAASAPEGAGRAVGSEPGTDLERDQPGPSDGEAQRPGEDRGVTGPSGPPG